MAKLPQNLAVLGIVLNGAVLTQIDAIQSAFGFLGGAAAWLVGLALVLAGAAVVMTTKFSPSIGRVGFMLTGAALALAGLSKFGVNLFSASTVAGFGLAFVVLGLLLSMSKFKIPVLSDFA